MLKHWLRKRGLRVRGLKRNSASYLKIGSRLVSLKISFEWDENIFMFQQIRQDTYDYALLLGISPARVNVWVVPRTEQRLFITPQHVGPKGPANHLVRVRVDDIPAWLNKYRGIKQLFE